ncbi:hypothetical protein FGB62_8g330 [Gracilaria domingensis]|nr:hypothetical protein FGB62_8g330 [Gracilaria domingensis]
MAADDRVYPQILSTCNAFEGKSLRYYPVAFDVEEAPPVPTSARQIVSTVNNNAGTAMDSQSVLCQRYEGARPLLTIPRCGSDPNSCFNLRFSSAMNVHLERGRGGPVVWEQNLLLENQASIIMRRNIQPVSFDDSVTTCDRLICLDFVSRMDSLSSNGESQMNCMLGTWNGSDTMFTFRLGKATFPNSKREQIFDVDQRSTMNFVAFTVETEIEWNASAEIIFSNGLHALRGNTVPVRSFMDILVSRSAVSVEVGDEVIFEQFDINVTDMSTGAVVGYAALTILAILVVLLKAASYRMSTYGDGENRCVPDITTYNGLLTILQGDERCQKGRQMERSKVEFGIMSMGKLYSLGPVQQDTKVVRMPKEGSLRWHLCPSNSASHARGDETHSISLHDGQ